MLERKQLEAVWSALEKTLNVSLSRPAFLETEFRSEAFKEGEFRLEVLWEQDRGLEIKIWVCQAYLIARIIAVLFNQFEMASVVVSNGGVNGFGTGTYRITEKKVAEREKAKK
jgi:hypothetical protein